MQLRPYQTDAIFAVYRHLRERDDNPCVVIPTGGGKTPVIASICKDAVTQWQGRVLILAHVKELLEQSAEKLRAICPDVRVGVYSAGLGRRDMTQPVIVAGIQSIYERACDFDPFDLVIVDEAHLIPPDGDGMYRRFLTDAKKVNPNLRVIGLTATPYRMKSGMICEPDGILNEICYEIGVRELIVSGYLSKLVTKAGVNKVDTSGLHIRAGEFVASEVEDLMESDGVVEAAVAEIVEQAGERRAVLIFAASVKHGRHIVEALKKNHNIECGFVCGETPDGERAELLRRFKYDPVHGDESSDSLFADEPDPLPYLCNVNVLTTGFDAPNVDCVALMRPTASPGLYYQMVGRGFRLFPGKSDCLVLDFGGNVLRHGPVDQIKIKEPGKGEGGEAPAKECPQCQALIAAGYARCPDCGFEFPPPKNSKHEAQASNAGILSGQVTDTEYAVRGEVYSVHYKRDWTEGEPRSMRVEYDCGLNVYKSEWICFEHDGYARVKAEAWWRNRSREPIPSKIEDAIAIVNAGGLAKTKSIVVRSIAGEPFERIIRYELGELQELLPAGAMYAPEDIPF